MVRESRHVFLMREIEKLHQAVLKAICEIQPLVLHSVDGWWVCGFPRILSWAKTQQTCAVYRLTKTVDFTYDKTRLKLYCFLALELESSVWFSFWCEQTFKTISRRVNNQSRTLATACCKRNSEFTTATFLLWPSVRGPITWLASPCVHSWRERDTNEKKSEIKRR